MGIELNMVYVIAAIVGLIVVAGVIAIIRVFSKKDEEEVEVAVPILDLQEIRTISGKEKATSNSALMQQLKNDGGTGNVTEQQVPAESKAKILKPPVFNLSGKKNISREQAEKFEQQIAQLTAINASLTEEIRQQQERAAEDGSLKQQEKDLLAAKDEQIEQAQKTISVLKSEKDSLNDKLDGLISDISQIENAFHSFKAKNEQLIEAKDELITKLQVEVNRMSADSEKVLELQAAIKDLTQEKEDFMNGSIMKAKDYDELKANYERIQRDFQIKLDAAEERQQLLKIKLEKASANSVKSQAEELDQLRKQIETLQAEKDSALVGKGKVEADYNRLKTYNEQLMEKEQLLQYQLMKQRAQAVGLEKICEDFRTQIDQAHNTPRGF